MTTLTASHTAVNWHNHGAWLATMTETVALDGTHEEVRSLAYRLIEAADRAKAEEWRKRTISATDRAELEERRAASVRATDAALNAAEAINREYGEDGDTSLEQAEAYLRMVGIEPDAVRGWKV